MDFEPIETEALVVEKANAGFKRRTIILKNMRADEVLVEMKYSGICHTDIIGAEGQYPMTGFPIIFGHEGAGIIKAIGSDVEDKSLQVGDEVILSYTYCGHCRQCRLNHPAFCANEPINLEGVRETDGSSPAVLEDGTPVRSQFFGQSSFSKMSVVSGHSVVRCPSPGSLALYASLGCGFQTGAGTILNALKPSPQQSVVIFGLGTVGLAAVMGAKLLGVKCLIATDMVPSKLAMAKQLGATHTINPGAVPDVAKAVLDITEEGADFVIDCAGSSKVLDVLLACTACGGTAAIVGTPELGYTFKFDALDFLLQNKILRGVVQGDSIAKDFIPEMVRLHQAGDFPIEKLCKVYKMSAFETALGELEDGKVVKAVLEWD